MPGFRKFGGGGEVWAIFEISRGLRHFQDPGGNEDLCRTMTFSRGVQTPDDTMHTLNFYVYERE